MNDDRGGFEPSASHVEGIDLTLDDEELGRTIREGIVAEERGRATATTDDESSPLPRLDMNDPRPSPTDEPLLRVGYAMLAELPEPLGLRCSHRDSRRE